MIKETEKNFTSRPTTRQAATHIPTLVDIARKRHETLASLIGSEKKNLDVEYIHDLRVAARRMTQVVRLMKPLIGRPTFDAIIDTLRDLRRSAGTLRDLDVMHEHFEKWHVPIGLNSLTAPLIQQYPTQRAHLLSKLEIVLSSVVLATAMKVMGRIIASHQAPSHIENASKLERQLSKTAKKRYRQFDKALSHAADKKTPKAFHEARIAAKKLRYVLELADESGRRGLRGQLQFLKRMQANLGDMHDTDVITERLEKHVADYDDPTTRANWAAFSRNIKKQQSLRIRRFFFALRRWPTLFENRK